MPTGPVAGPRRLPAARRRRARAALRSFEVRGVPGRRRACLGGQRRQRLGQCARADLPDEWNPGGIEGFVGFGDQDPVGLTPVVISYVDLLGQAESVRYDLRVLRTQWTVLYFTPGELDADEPAPNPNAPPPPPDEGPLLPGLYAMRTPRKWSGAWQAPLDGALDVTGYFGERRWTQWRSAFGASRRYGPWRANRDARAPRERGHRRTRGPLPRSRQPRRRYRPRRRRALALRAHEQTRRGHGAAGFRKTVSSGTSGRRGCRPGRTCTGNSPSRGCWSTGCNDWTAAQGF